MKICTYEIIQNEIIYVEFGGIIFETIPWRYALIEIAK